MMWGVLAVGWLGASAGAPDDACPPDGYWPGARWPERVATTAAERTEIADALDAHLFPADLDREHPDRIGVRTDGIVVVHRGTIVYERYGGPYERQTKHLAWSATKTFTNALVGIAVGEGLLKLSDSVCTHLPDAPEAACPITVQHLLEFSSGFDWSEVYEEGASPRASSVVSMLYGEGQPDMAAFVTAHPLRDPPGTTWMYSSGDTNVLAAILGEVLGGAHGERFPFTELLEPIGMQATWERDGAGTYVGSSYLYATPRDLARFGTLWLHDGCWQGQRLLPEGWVEASTAVSEPMRTKALARGDGGVQGRQVWLNRTVPEIGQTTPRWPSAPESTFAAMGHWKQSITVLPEAELVIVRTADDRDGTYSHDETLRLAQALVATEGGP